MPKVIKVNNKKYTVAQYMKKLNNKFNIVFSKKN